MNDRKKFYALDDIGFVGTQEKKTPEERLKEQILTGEAIRKYKAEAAAAKAAATRKVKKAS